MKKLFSFLTVALCAFVAQGQWVESPAFESMAEETTQAVVIPSYDYRAGGGTIWSEDFANGFPATWATDDLSGLCPWVYSTDGSYGPFSAGGTTAGGPAISSTTGSNGFLINDPDSANDTNFGQPSGSTYQYLESYFVTSAIDLTNDPAVLLQFEQNFRFNNAPDLQVMVSNDSATWTTWNVQGSTAANANSSDPETISLNISAVAGGQPTVYLKFGWSARVYFWMIDDIRIVEVPAYDKGALFSVITHTGDGFEYGRVPQSQLPTDITIGLYASNNGVANQNNVLLAGEITDAAGSSVISTSQSFPIVMQDDTVFFENAEPTSGLVPGIYDGVFTVNSDEDSLDISTTNDTLLRQFEITDPTTGLYGLDGIDVYDNPVLSSMGTASFVDGEDGFILMSFFRIINSATFPGAEALLANGTVAGGEVIFSIHNFADVDAGDVFSPLEDTPTLTVEPLNLADGRIGGAFNNPVTLAPGDYYLAMTMNSLGNSSDVVVLDDETVPQPFGAGLIYLSNNATPGPFTNPNAPALRLSLDATIGIDESVEQLNFVISPNPSNGLIRIDSPEEGKLDVEVRNMVGQLVLTEQFSSYTNLDLSGSAKGVYSVRLSNGTTTHTQLVTLR